MNRFAFLLAFAPLFPAAASPARPTWLNCRPAVSNRIGLPETQRRMTVTVPNARGESTVAFFRGRGVVVVGPTADAETFVVTPSDRRPATVWEGRGRTGEISITLAPAERSSDFQLPSVVATVTLDRGAPETWTCTDLTQPQ